MKRHGVDNKKGHIAFFCPAKYMGRTKGKPTFKVNLEACPLGTLCEPDTKMGPLVYLPFEENPRLNTAIPRGSDLFKQLYNQRSGTERFFSRLQIKGSKERPYRREHLFGIAVLADSLTAHAMAWVKKRFGGRQPKDNAELFEWMKSLCNPENTSTD